MEAPQKENGWGKKLFGLRRFLFPRQGGEGNKISLWVKSWGLLWEGIDRRRDTEEKGSPYQILLTLTRTHPSLLIKTVYAHTLIGIQVPKLFLLLNTTLTQHQSQTPIFISVRLIKQIIYSFDPHSEADIFCHRLHFNTHIHITHLTPFVTLFDYCLYGNGLTKQ